MGNLQSVARHGPTKGNIFWHCQGDQLKADESERSTKLSTLKNAMNNNGVPGSAVGSRCVRCHEMCEILNGGNI